MTAVRLAATADIPSGEARRFELDGRWIAVANLGEQGFRAVDAICSHQHAWLDEGDVEADGMRGPSIECPLHGSTFSLDTGAPLCLPATQPVRTYPLSVDGDDLLIEVE